MQWCALFIWLIGLSAVAQSEVEVVRVKLARARKALSSQGLTDDERRTLKDKLDAADTALAEYVSVLKRGDKRNTAVTPLYVVGGAVVADDVTGIGVADDSLLPVIALGVAIAHAATPSPATDDEIKRAWLALIASLETASTVAVEMARRKKPGCYCQCFKKGEGPSPGKRVESPEKCVTFCLVEEPGRYSGYRCGGDVIWP